MTTNGSAKEEIDNLLKTHQPFKEAIQKKIGRDRVVVYAVYLLENKNIEPTFQRICLVVFKLCPESFSFTEFPEYPDSRIVRNCLWHCVHSSKNWLIGSDKTHYTITEKGQEIVQIFIKFVGSNLDTKTLPFELQLKGITKKELTTKPTDTEIRLLK